MGVVQLFKGEFTKAIFCFDEAIEIFPDFVEGWYNKGAAHQKKLEIEGIVVSCRKVIEQGD